MRDTAENSSAEQESYRAKLQNLTVAQAKEIADAVGASFSTLNKFRLQFSSSLKPLLFEAAKEAYAARYTPSGRVRK